MAADDQDMPGGVDVEIWEITPIGRERGPFDVFVDGALVFDLAALAAELLATIDAEAGALRSRFITVSPGQDMAYMRKEAEGRALVKGEPGPFTMIEAEAAATGVSVEALAVQVVAIADQWIPLAAKIEAARMKAKKAVRGAQSEEEMRAAARVDWEKLLDPGKPVDPLGSAVASVKGR